MTESSNLRERGRNIETTMKNAYLEYAMSVIVGRALPDARDGLKPVHRRILYAMKELNLAHNRPFMKSARIVGEVIGKFHPHGDSAVYDATVRMAQEFSMRYPMIDGQGNFGSVDGDSPAAMRYTEVRLERITGFMLEDLEKNTVDFGENYDGSLQEPLCLPARIPALLINGSTGIAVGMATNIPPHNIGEILDALLYVIDSKNDFETERLLEIVSGPDFPTGGQILGRRGIRDAYTTGRGSVRIQSKTHVEEISGGREAIVVDELPYAVNKAKLIEKIAFLVKDKKIQGISDIRDESDRRGMRVVIELKRGEIPEPVLANLMKQTSMLTTFGVIMLAVVDGMPKVMNLHETLHHFLNHRVDVVTRRTRFELNKAQNRAHILKGLKVALDNIDAVIGILRKSENANAAKENLRVSFDLDEKQAQSILEMRLQRLTALEREKLETELAELLEKIEEYRLVLKEKSRVYEIMRQEFVELKAVFGDGRKTEILEEESEIEMDDLIPEEAMVITLSKEGFVKRCPTEQYRNQNRGGRGKMGMATRNEDFLEQILTASTHDTLLLFSNLGKVYWKKAYGLPLGGRTAKGRSMVNILPLDEGEKIVSLLPIRSFDEDISLLMATEKGVVKKTKIEEYRRPRKVGLRAILIDEDDALVNVKTCTEEDLVFLATYGGLATKFPSSQIRNIGRSTRGMRGIKLKELKGTRDRLVSLEIVSKKEELFDSSCILTVSEKGYGKKTLIDQYRLGGRGNQGVLNLKIGRKNGNVVASVRVGKEDDVLLITQTGRIIRFDVGQMRSMGRNTQGVRLIQLDENEYIVGVSKVVEID